MPYKYLKDICKLHRKALGELAGHYANKPVEVALNDYNVVADSTANIHKMFLFLISGTLIAFAALLGNLLVEGSRYDDIIDWLKTPLILLLLSLIFIALAQIFLGWFIGTGFVITPTLVQIRVRYFKWSGICGWVAGILFIFSLVITIFIVAAL